MEYNTLLYLGRIYYLIIRHRALRGMACAGFFPSVYLYTPSHYFKVKREPPHRPRKSDAPPCFSSCFPAFPLHTGLQFLSLPMCLQFYLGNRHMRFYEVPGGTYGRPEAPFGAYPQCEN